MVVEGCYVQKASMVWIHKGKLVLVQRKASDNKHGKQKDVVWWELPGGKADCNEETASQAAVRELREETGLRAQGANVILLGIESYRKGQLAAVFMCSAGRCSGKIHNAAPDEHLAVRAFSPRKLKRLASAESIRIPPWVFDQFIHTGDVHSNSLSLRLS